MGQNYCLSARLATLGILFAAPGMAFPAQEALSQRWYDLRGIVRPESTGDQPVDMRLPLEAANLNQLTVESGPPLHPRVKLAEAEIADFISRSITRAPDATLELRRDLGGRLLLTANEEGHRIARSIVDQATQWSQAGATIELIELGGESIPAGTGSILTGPATDKLLSDTGARSLGVRFLRFGENGVLGEESATTYVQDYDVEVASGAIGADVCVSILKTGARVGIRADLDSDREHVVLRAFGRRAEIDGPIRSIALPAFAESPLEMPALGVALFSCSARLGVGDALIMHAGHPDAPAMIARVASLSVPAPTGESSALLLGDALLGDRRRDPIQMSRAEASNGGPDSKQSLAALAAPWSTAELPVATDATDFVDEVLGEPARATQILSLGNIGLFSGDRAQLAGLRTRAKGLSEGLARSTIEISVAYRIMDSDEAVQLSSSADFRRFVDAAGTRRLRGACLEGDTLQLTGGRDFAYLQDHDVQIAGGATIMDPIIQHLFEGFSFWCSPTVIEGSQVSAWVDLRFLDEAPEPRQTAAARFSYPRPSSDEWQPRAVGDFILDLPIEPPESREARIIGPLPPLGHDWSFLASEAIAGSDRNFVAVIRMAVQ